jgi:flavodoxin
MKTLVVYYSRDGLTKKIGGSLAGLLQAETEELIDLTSRQGLWGWLFAGRDAFRQKLTKLKKPAKSPADYDLVVIGSPVWASNITPAIRTYLTESKGKIKKTAFFACKGGTSTTKFFAEMERLSGRRPLADMEIKKGEEQSGIATHKMLQFIEEIKRNA